MRASLPFLLPGNCLLILIGQYTIYAQEEEEDIGRDCARDDNNYEDIGKPSRLDPILIHTSGIGTDMGTHLEMEKYGRNNYSPRILV